MSLLHGLALLCGICLMGSGRAQPIGLSASKDMEEDIRTLRDHFKTDYKNNKGKFHGQSLFLKTLDILDKLQGMEKYLLTGEVLEVSEKILSGLLNGTKEEEIRKTIHAVKGRVQSLKKDMHPMNQEFKKHLKALWDIKAEQSITQQKALRELMAVYSKGSDLANDFHDRKTKRRRRQVSRCKGTPLL